MSAVDTVAVPTADDRGDYAALESLIDAFRNGPLAQQSPVDAAAELLGLAEQVLEHWLLANGKSPTNDTREGFRLLALHRQGAQGDPSFNACRESCRELAYYYNKVVADSNGVDARQQVSLAASVAYHLYLFVGGKLAVAELGDFCCSSQANRQAKAQ